MTFAKLDSARRAALHSQLPRDDHRVYEAVNGLRDAPEDVQRQWREQFDAHVENLRRHEDEEWMRMAHEDLVRQGVAYAPNDPNDWKVPPTGDGLVIDGFSRINFKIDSYIEPDRIMDLKLQELQKISNRSRVGSAVPPSKSKAAKRKKAKASKLARKQQRRV